MVASFDWNLFITAVSTLAGAGVGAVTGVLVARYQAKQTRWEREDAQRQVRQQVYVDFLNAANGLLTLTERQGETITRHRFFRWVDDYTKHYNALLLGGVPEVSRFLTTFGPIQRGLFEKLTESFKQLQSQAAIDDQTAFDRAVRDACDASELQRRKGIHELVNIMRHDVAPGGESIYDVSAGAHELHRALEHH